jgi:hypothetical protein
MTTGARHVVVTNSGHDEDKPSVPATGHSPANLKQRSLNMQEHSKTDAIMDPRSPKERRKDIRKRQIVEFGVLIGDTNLISGVEYLQSQGVEAHIIERVLLESLSRRLSSHQPDEPVSLQAHQAA